MTTHTTHADRLPELLSLRELSEYLGYPASTLYYWRLHGKGPKGFRLGKQLRYRTSDVEAWLQEQAGRTDAA